MSKFISIVFLFTFVCLHLCIAQNERSYAREGNSEYKNSKFPEAELKYRKSLEKNQQYDLSKFNLGNALYKQGKYDEAIQQYSDQNSVMNDKEALSKRYYNIGNSLFKNEKYEESIEAYKKALRNDPDDEDARYNLSYAMTKLAQQQQQQQDNKDKDKKEQQQQQKQQQQQNEENKKEEQKQQEAQQKQQKISKEDAERILQALKNEEKELQDKMKLKEGKITRPEKDW
ncbi:MAG TPA: tetratricopeptide repeat protein [Bacteroidia bacterium]|nr:tetratricopeptide repeat protein [Bacteroidia bacterium]HNT80917.1 tetratricopeptide repeat protein [Bacteroidia bacterium]